MKSLDPEQVKKFAVELAGLTPGSNEYNAAHQSFLEYAAEFIALFSYHYHDFVPRADGNIDCTMEDYISPRKRVAFIINSQTGFIKPLGQDVQRGGKYQGM